MMEIKKKKLLKPTFSLKVQMYVDKMDVLLMLSLKVYLGTNMLKKQYEHIKQHISIAEMP